MNSVTSNAVAGKFSALGETVTMLGYVSTVQTTLNFSSSIKNFKQILVVFENTETPKSVAARLYPSKYIQNNYDNLYHDIARFDGTYYLALRYKFDNATQLRIINKDGPWGLNRLIVYGIN